MKTMRLLALPAIAAAAVLTMTGCFQLPGAPTTNPGTSTAPTDGGGDAVDLSDTSWSGTDAAGNDLAFTLNADGTVDFQTFGQGGPYDSATDTWTVSGSSFEMYVSDIQEIGGLTYSGTAAIGSMQLTGVDDNGDSGYDVTITQG